MIATSLTRLVNQGFTHEVILSDLDGCLVSGKTVLPGARALVDRHPGRVWIVSNNSEDTAVSLSQRLARLGLKIDADQVITAGETMVRSIAKEHPGARLAWFGTKRLAELARSLSLTTDREDPEIAALTRDPAMDGHDLTELMRLASKGVPVWVANPDPSHPAADGTPVAETGAWWAAVTAAVPVTAARVVGKPSPDLLRVALTRAGVEATDAIMIGDTPVTDGAAARAAGVTFRLVERLQLS
ncbi:MAG: HAD family hydrolase [Nitriliruptoraceae bacterium]